MKDKPTSDRGMKPIDHVTTDRLRAALLALDVDLSEDQIELIIEVTELLEDTQGSPSLDQIIKVGETCRKGRSLPQTPYYNDYLSLTKNQ